MDLSRAVAVVAVVLAVVIAAGFAIGEERMAAERDGAARTLDPQKKGPAA